MASPTASTGRPPETGREPSRQGLWEGRAAVLIGIVLLGISLRYAVTGLNPPHCWPSPWRQSAA